MSQIIRNKYGLILASILVSLITISVVTSAVATHPTHDNKTSYAGSATSTGTTVWTNPSKAAGAPNSDCATTSKKNAVLTANGFSFPIGTGSGEIPAGSIIDGIEVRIKSDQSSAGSAWDVRVGQGTTFHPTIKDTVTPFVATSCGATKVDAGSTAGSNIELWGLPWDTTKINTIKVTISSGGTTNAKRIDAVQVAVYYTPDLTPPNVTLSSVLIAPGGQGGWLNANDIPGASDEITVTAVDAISNVTDISCTDNGSSKIVAPDGAWGDSTSESGTFTVSGQGTHSIVCVATDSFNNTGDEDNSGNTATYMIDTFAPNTVGTPDRAADFNGWYNAPFTVNWLTASTDPTPGSGIASCSPNQTYSTPDTSSGTLNGTCTDFAGNSDPGTFQFKFDNTNPILTLPTTYTPLEEVGLGGAAIEFEVTATDNSQLFSPPAPDPTVACIPPSGSTFPIGTTLVNCTATDFAGNVTPDSFDMIVSGDATTRQVPTGPNTFEATITGGATWACHVPTGICGPVVGSNNSPITMQSGLSAMRFDDTKPNSEATCYFNPATALDTYCEEWILDGQVLTLSSIAGECDTDGIPETPPESLDPGETLACANGKVTAVWSVSNGSSLTIGYIFEEGKPVKHLVTSIPIPTPPTFITQQWPLTADELVLQGTVLGDGRTITLNGAGVAKGFGFWKNNPTETQEHLPLSLGTHAVNFFDDPNDSIGDAKAIFDAADSNENAMDKLAAELLTAKLNEQIDVNNGCVVVAIKKADDMLAAPPVPYAGVGTKPEPAAKTPVINLKNELAAFNSNGCPNPSFTLTKTDLFGDPPVLQDTDPVLIFNNAGQVVATENLKSAFNEFDSLTITRSGIQVIVQFRYVFDGELDPATATLYGQTADGNVYRTTLALAVTKDSTTPRVRTPYIGSTATFTEGYLVFNTASIVTANPGKTITITSVTLKITQNGTPVVGTRTCEFTSLASIARPDSASVTALGVWDAINNGVVYAPISCATQAGVNLGTQANTDLKNKLVGTYSATGGYFAVGVSFAGIDAFTPVADPNTSDSVTAQVFNIVGGTSASGSTVPVLTVGYTVS